jgi:hypothetical protein
MRSAASRPAPQPHPCHSRRGHLSRPRAPRHPCCLPHRVPFTYIDRRGNPSVPPLRSTPQPHRLHLRPPACFTPIWRMTIRPLSRSIGSSSPALTLPRTTPVNLPPPPYLRGAKPRSMKLLTLSSILHGNLFNGAERRVNPTLNANHGATCVAYTAFPVTTPTLPRIPPPQPTPTRVLPTGRRSPLLPPPAPPSAAALP